jgi:hypothetical protein
MERSEMLIMVPRISLTLHPGYDEFQLVGMEQK